MILVTGGSGLLGRELINQLLPSGEKIRALVNKTSLNVAGVESFPANILDVVALEEALAGITKVYHCAGLVSFDPSDRKQLYKINHEGTANIVQAALDAGVQKFVHVSSVAALGRLRVHAEVDETMVWEEHTSNSIYGHSKFMGEMEVWRAMAEGLNAAIINPSLILGPGDWNESSIKLFKTAYEEFPYYTNGVTGIVDVRDVAKAMILLMESGVTDEKFIISGHNVSYKDLLSTIAKAFGKKPPSKEVSKTLAALVWRFEKLKGMISGNKPLLTKETAATSFAKVFYNNNKFLKAFPAFAYTPFNETVNFTVEALQQKLNKP